MSISDLIMVFEVHIKEQVHSISYQMKHKPMCLVYTANYKHAYCMYKTYNYKKTWFNKDFTFTVVAHWQSCLPEISVMAREGEGGRSKIEQIQEICRGQGGEWWQNLIANTVMANSLWKKKIKIYTSEMLQWCDSEILLYSYHYFLFKNTKERTYS